MNNSSFRPLIRGFFFYFCAVRDTMDEWREYTFPSPHSGILFLSKEEEYEVANEFMSFRPLIRGFFFYKLIFCAVRDTMDEVSVPSFGDSFFILSL